MSKQLHKSCINTILFLLLGNSFSTEAMIKKEQVSKEQISIDGAIQQDKGTVQNNLVWKDIPVDLHKIIMGYTGYSSFVQTLKAVALYRRVCSQWNALFHSPLIISYVVNLCRSAQLSNEELHTLRMFLVFVLSTKSLRDYEYALHFIACNKLKEKRSFADQLIGMQLMPLKPGQEAYSEVAKVLVTVGLGWGGDKPLHGAVGNGDSETVKILLANGCDKEVQNRHKKRPLHVAAEHGHAEIVKVLIAAGADGEAVGEHGQRPLHVAAAHGHEEVVGFLLANGVLCNSRSDHDETPLLIACKLLRRAVIGVLLAHGADTEAENACHERPIHLIASFGDVPAGRLLLASGVDKDAPDRDGFTPLRRAADKGHVEFVKELLAAGANKAALDKEGRGVTYRAERQGYSAPPCFAEIVKLLTNSICQF